MLRLQELVHDCNEIQTQLRPKPTIASIASVTPTEGDLRSLEWEKNSSQIWRCFLEGTELYMHGNASLTPAFRRQSKEPREVKASQSYTTGKEGKRKEGHLFF